MKLRNVAVQLAVVPVFAFLALGSAAKPTNDKSSPAGSATSTTELTSAGPVLGSCLKANKCLEDLPNGREEWQAKGECTGGLTEHGTWRPGVGCPIDRRFIGSCLHVESVGSYRTYDYLKDGEQGDPKLEMEACGADKWTPNPAFAKASASSSAKTTATAAKPAQAKPAAKPAQAPKKK